MDFQKYWNMEPMKYWSFPKNYTKNKKDTAKDLCLSGYYIGARKMDGIWAMVIKDNQGVIHMRARNKHTDGSYQDKSSWIPHIVNQLTTIPNNTVLIGELYLPEHESAREVTSVLNCLLKRSLSRQSSEPVHFYIFDTLVWNNIDIAQEPLEKRVESMKKNLVDTQYIHPCQYLEGADLWNFYCDILDKGGEGVVIQKKENPYTFGKRVAWASLKLKKELSDTIDAFLDGAYKSSTKEYTGKDIENWAYWVNIKTGAHINECRYKDYITGAPIEPVTKGWFYGWASAVSFSVMRNGEPYRIAWVSGITDELKQEIIQCPQKWKNKVAELNAMELDNINGHYSLRHSRIMSWREDKAPDDCLFSQITAEI